MVKYKQNKKIKWEEKDKRNFFKELVVAEERKLKREKSVKVEKVRIENGNSRLKEGRKRIFFKIMDWWERKCRQEKNKKTEFCRGDNPERKNVRMEKRRQNI